MDNRSKEARSANMSHIPSKNTKPEEIVRKYLYSHGLRYRKNVKDLPGKPDIVLKKYNAVVFINGCFWHAHEGCKWFVMPKTNTDFWEKKFSYNIKRDNDNFEKLCALGWRVKVVWECEIRHGKCDDTLEKLYNWIVLSSTEY